MAASTHDRPAGSPRLDTHQYFWSLDQIARGHFPWMPARGVLREDHSPERLEPHVRATDVGGTVAVQAAANLEETLALLDIARSTPFVLGVTGWADLSRPDAADTLESLAADENLLALRPMLHDIEDPRWVTRPEVRTSLGTLSNLGRRFEALTRPKHLPALCEAIDAVPELPVVIDHLSKPHYEWDADEPWRTWMARCAERPATYCKISGMLTEVGPVWHADDFQPYVDFLFETFGTDRVMFGSDWPVSRQRLEYPDVVDLTDHLVSGLSPEEAEAFWRGNAERFYGVDLTP
ncbi:amidohydrolase family protein [Streptomyces sp. NPDC058665]|uniref:amidohydrolase family protein n=1 Tax=Streptomyces sp. NPDC058665 TaxID=3346586 RepID=UPI003648FCB9